MSLQSTRPKSESVTLGKKRNHVKRRRSPSLREGVSVREPLGRDSAKVTLSLMGRGGHIGHSAASTLQPCLRYPSSPSLIYGKRGSGDMVCPSLSADQAARGLHLIGRILQQGGHLLVIDTRGETSALHRLVEGRSASLPSSISFGSQHWTGGTLTNWDRISKMVRRCARISNQFDNFLVKNRVNVPRYEKMTRSYPGFLDVHTPPCKDSSVTTNGNPKRTEKSHTSGVKLTGWADVLLVINPAENKHIVNEAVSLGIPIVGFVDSNESLKGITVPVPINTGSLIWPDLFAIYAVQLATCLDSRGGVR